MAVVCTGDPATFEDPVRMTDILKSGSSPREARASHFASMLRLSAVTGRIFHAT